MGADPPLVGVVLAGGRSRRMGRDKADLVLPGDRRTLLRSTVDRLAAVCAEVLVADGGRGRLAEQPSVADGPGRGPAAGILGARAARPGHDLLVLACDLPAVTGELLRALADASGHDLVVPLTERGPEPLCARWGTAALDALGARVAAGRFDLVGLLDAPPDGLRIARWPRDGDEFVNLNRPVDVDRFAALRHSLLRGRSTTR